MQARLRLFALKFMPGKPHSHTGQGCDCDFEWHLHTGRNSEDLVGKWKVRIRTARRNLLRQGAS